MVGSFLERREFSEPSINFRPLSLFQSICIPDLLLPTYMYVLSYIDIVKYYLTTYIKTRQPFKSPWLKSLISFHFIEVLSLLLLSSLERHPQSSFWYQFSARIRHPLKTAFPENCIRVLTPDLRKNCLRFPSDHFCHKVNDTTH